MRTSKDAGGRVRGAGTAELQPLPAAEVIIILSGPISSVICGQFFALLALTSTDSVSFAVFSRLFFWSFLGVLELLSGNGRSDGDRLRQVMRGGDGVDDLIRDSMAESSNFTSLRYRDWPRAVIVRLAERQDSYDYYLAYLHAMDSGELEAALAHMRSLMAQLASEKPNSYLACEAVDWLATEGGDVVEARKWLELIGPDLAPELSQGRGRVGDGRGAARSRRKSGEGGGSNSARACCQRG